jgi:hypothetical protein
MLYLIHQANHPELAYRGGQEPIIHLEADLRDTVTWADTQNHRWAFTLSNAGAYYFEDRADLANLGEIDWIAVQTRDWWACKEGKQAEFLLERSFPWHLVERIGILNRAIYHQVFTTVYGQTHRPRVETLPDWYY